MANNLLFETFLAFMSRASQHKFTMVTQRVTLSFCGSWASCLQAGCSLPNQQQCQKHRREFASTTGLVFSWPTNRLTSDTVTHTGVYTHTGVHPHRCISSQVYTLPGVHLPRCMPAFL